ncbi:hypothetical protein GGR27_000727 [Lewinella antarctica]|uniref:Uncharacterized protein n=1 Tax=Neolewinella antarctica TaxID=442734 RepID=A0ABX0X7M2_9BACT|nr:hypothetical protein [Neolewinella antarctica]
MATTVRTCPHLCIVTETKESIDCSPTLLADAIFNPGFPHSTTLTAGAHKLLTYVYSQ